MNELTIEMNDVVLEEKINVVLQSKFSLVSSSLKSVLKIASKGPRKGKLIFTQDAPNKIHAIDDTFVRFVVRSIYDNYSDAKNGVIWRIHMNELFSGDFIKGIMFQLYPEINELNNKLEAMKKENSENQEKKELYNIKWNKFDKIYSRNLENVFNPNNEQSKPFYTAYNALKAKVKAEHPRVPDDKMYAYIEKTYEYRNQFDTIVKEFLNSIPEYVSVTNKLNALTDEHWKNESDLSDLINEKLKALDYTNIRKNIEKVVNNFCTLISNSLIAGTI